MPDIYLIGPQTGETLAVQARREEPLTAWSSTASVTMVAVSTEPEDAADALCVLLPDSATITRSGSPLRITEWADSRASSPRNFTIGGGLGPEYLTSAVNGQIGAGFDGAGTPYRLESADLRAVGRSAFSLSILFRVTAFVSTHYLYDDSDGTEGVILRITSTGDLIFYVYNELGTLASVTWSTPLATATNYVVSAWADGTNIHLSVDGAASETAALALTTIGASGGSTYEVSVIGAQSDASSGALDGAISAFAVADRRTRFTEAETKFLTLGGIT